MFYKEAALTALGKARLHFGMGGTTTGARTDGAVTARKCKVGFGNAAASISIIFDTDTFFGPNSFSTGFQLVFFTVEIATST
jgi:hypothetical protein